MDNNNNNTLTETEIAEAKAVSNTYTLTEDEQAQIQAIATEIQALQSEANVVLKAIARAHKLNGNWAFDANTNTFTKGTA